MNAPPRLRDHEGAPQCIRFGRFTADLNADELRIDGRPLIIEPQPRRLLMHLIRQRHRVVSKQEVLEEVFGREEVSASALSRAVMKARQAVEQDGSAPAIATVPRVGYRFVAEVDTGGLGPGEGGRGLSLAILPFDDATDEPNSAWVRSGLPSLVGEMLETERRITLVPMTSVLGAVAALRSDTVPQQVARLQRATGAAAVVHARVTASAHGLKVDFRMFNGGRVITGSVSEKRSTDLALETAKALGGLLGCAVDYAAAAAALPQDAMAAEAYFRGRQAMSDQRLESALHLFRLAHDLEPSHTATALRLLRQLAARTETSDEARSLAAKLLRKAEPANDRATVLEVHHALVDGLLSRHMPEEATSHIDRMLAVADEREGPLFWSDIHQMLAIVAHARSRYEEARSHLAQSRRFCVDAGHRAKLMWLLGLEAGLAPPQEAAELALKGARGARQLGLPRTLAHTCVSASKALIKLGRLAEAVSYAAEGFAAAASSGSRNLAESLVECSALACRLAGWPSTAQRALEELDALPGPPRFAHYVFLARGLLHGSRGEWSRAAVLTGRALEEAPFPALRAYMLPWHAEALILSDRLDEAQALFEQAPPASSARTESRVPMLLARAALAHRRGDPEAALALLDEALALGPAPMWHAWARADAAWLHAQAGRSTEAGRLIEQVDPTLAALPLVTAARARVQHAAGDVQAALALHQRFVADRKEPAWSGYFDRLGEAYEQQTRTGIAALPPAPFLPSRLG